MVTNQLVPLTNAQIGALAANLNPARVATLAKGRTKLSYLEAWDVKASLIKVFGFGGFSAEVLDSEMLFREQVKQSGESTRMNWKITFRARVQLTIHQTGAVYTEDAIADSSQPDFTEAADMAMKSAESDALKRAAIYLGTQFGLSLYNAGSTNSVAAMSLAPGAEWPPLAPAASQQAPQQLQQQMLEAPAPVIEMGTANPIQDQVLLPSGNLTQAQTDANRALLNRALTARAEKDAEAAAAAPTADTTQYAEAIPDEADPSSYEGVAAVLEG